MKEEREKPQAVSLCHRWWHPLRWGWVLVVCALGLAHCAGALWDAAEGTAKATPEVLRCAPDDKQGQEKEPSEKPGKSAEEQWPLPERILEYRQFGCLIESAVFGGKPGYKVTVWADHVERHGVKVQERPWRRWLAWREGVERGEEQAHQDCLQWRREFRKARQKAATADERR